MMMMMRGKGVVQQVRPNILVPESHLHHQSSTQNIRQVPVSLLKWQGSRSRDVVIMSSSNISPCDVDSSESPELTQSRMME